MIFEFVVSRFSGTPLSTLEDNQYRQLCYQLQYATLTHPEFLFVVNKLFQYIHCATDLHAQSSKRVLRFIKDILNYDLLIKKYPNGQFCGFDLAMYFELTYKIGLR